MSQLFKAFHLGGHDLRNRIVMAPMTRARAQSHTPTESTARYYRQRAGAGLIVTEGAAISQEGVGFANCPGIWSDAQVASWRGVTESVHEVGGVIFTELWHVGRVSHVSLQPYGAAPVSSSARQALKSHAFGFAPNGDAQFVPASPPRELSTEEVGRVVNDFAAATANAARAGFDGVELHGANGYLLEQFLNPSVNRREDRYGATSLTDRLRFVLEVVDACVARIGSHRVGIRLSPFGRLHELDAFPEEEETFLALAAELGQRKLAYVHLMDQSSRGAPALPLGFLAQFRRAYSGPLILAGGLTRESAEQLLGDGLIDLAAFGALFVSNPDLVERLRHDWPVASTDPAVFYGGTDEGYTDFPVYSSAQPA
ncbi:alkene reductase [Roseateles terrae]|uniref:2,4-dienoyl-CoA reductase-like NADH-dependent reductase (Old Yellow Enzyme family) n=1 Tax=Roseateles terrae TaxID=431060 RepID=A0ABR6GUS6_9BURK|nr:alkene reductase [Roseateles terrae]MBB3195862.1 2,4-dienoyl-CoA reductase-like NADH-dependent reductase (Old Yellow Enzyme family) [Roseateles terrae]OWQ86731.1 alkene reductase [Roseateles terrae]